MKTYRRIMMITAIAFLATTGNCEEKKVETDPVLVRLRGRIEKEFGKLNPLPTFQIPKSSAGRSLVVRYKTRQYNIHPTNKAGRISTKTIQREGPSNDGFLLHAHVQAFGEINQAKVPQNIRQAYWSLYLQVYGMKQEKKQIYFALSYNSKTDPKLIKKLKEIAEQITSLNSDSATPPPE